MLVLLLIGVAVGLVLAVGSDGSRRRVGDSLTATSVVLGLVIGFLEAAARYGAVARRPYGFLAVILGADGRFSTSKAITFLWTMTLAAILIFLTGLVLWGGQDADKVFSTDDWNEYFLLLGGPFAAAVAAKGIVVGKLQTGSLAKTTTPAASSAAITPAATATAPSAPAAPAAPGAPPVASAEAPTGLADVVSTDDGEVDLVDSQYAIFNLVALFYVIGVFVASAVNAGDLATVRLPSIPSALLGLTGVSALTYVGNKAVQQTGAPRIQSINTSTPTIGTLVTVRVVNLDSTATLANTQVLLTPQAGGSAVSIAPTLVAGGQVQFVVPAPTGVFGLSIVAPNGMETDATPLTVT